MTHDEVSRELKTTRPHWQLADATILVISAKHVLVHVRAHAPVH